MKNLAVLRDKALLVRTTQGEEITSLIPESEIIERWGKSADVFVPWTVANSAILACLGAPTVSPIMRDYAFPSQYESPFRHQFKIANFLSIHHRAYCFAGMGTGKTYSAAWAADYLYRQDLVKKILVVCPLSIMHTAWAETLFYVCADVPHTVLHGTAAKRRSLAKDGRVWHIINHDGIGVIQQELENNKYDLIIIDETTAFKNATAKRWKNMSKLITPDTKVWGLTGTPRPNGPDEVYGQAKLITPDTIKVHFGRFKDSVMQKVGEFRWVERPEANARVKQALSPAIWINKEDCLDLPDKVDVYDEVPLSKEQKKAFDDLRKEMLLEFNEVGATITAANAAVKTNKLLQVASGAVYSDEGDIIQLDSKPRLSILPDWIRTAWAEAGDVRRAHKVIQGKTIIYAPFVHTLSMIEEYLMGQGFDVATLSGSVGVSKRKRIFDAFQNTQSIDVIVAIPQTMSHGVTATSASQIIWYAPCLSGETYQQACNRIDRPGQRCMMTVRHLYATPLERKYYSVLQDRHSNQQTLLSLYQDFIKGD